MTATEHAKRFLRFRAIRMNLETTPRGFEGHDQGSSVQRKKRKRMGRIETNVLRTNPDCDLYESTNISHFVWTIFLRMNKRKHNLIFVCCFDDFLMLS